MHYLVAYWPLWYIYISISGAFVSPLGQLGFSAIAAQ